MSEKIIVLGGGISGLSVGINARLNGYDCLIIEKNNKVGGCCGAYTRRGFLIDHCIHWLIGTNKETQQYEVWKKLHAFKEDTTFFYLNDLVTIEYDGKIYRFSKDYKKSKEELLINAPEDEEMINELFSYIEGAANVNMKVDFFTFFRNFKHGKGFIETCKIDRIEYAKKFKNEGMRRLITNAQNGYCNLMFFLFEYSCFIHDNANIPSGGSSEFANNIKNYYLELGGELITGEEVTDIIVENKKVTKVIAGDKEYVGDHYVCAFSPYYAFDKLLNAKYIDKELIKRKNIAGDTCPSVTQVCFTVEEDISSWPTPFGIDANNIKVGTKNFPCMMLRSYGYDKDLYVKNGKTVVCILFDQNREDYDYWEGLSKEQYELEKNRIQKEVFDNIEKRFPELKGKLELLDIITPLSMKKWTNSLYGAYQSFSVCNKSKFYYHTPKIKGITNLYLTGMWTLAPGGLPVAGQAGDLIIPFIKNKYLDEALDIIGVN